MRPIFAAKGIDSAADMDESSLDAGNLHEIDLNRCSDELNQKAKAIMSQEFESKRLKPGDPDFVYDKRIDFEPTESNEWDED